MSLGDNRVQRLSQTKGVTLREHDGVRDLGGEGMR